MVKSVEEDGLNAIDFSVMNSVLKLKLAEFLHSTQKLLLVEHP